MSRATRKLRQRCQALGDQAKVLVTRGQHDEALARLGEALDIAGGLAEAAPAAARPQQMRAVIAAAPGGTRLPAIPVSANVPRLTAETPGPVRCG